MKIVAVRERSIPIHSMIRNAAIDFSEMTISAAAIHTDVSINGNAVLRDFDVLAQAGGKNRALVKEFPITISAGRLTIAFTAKTNYPEINALEVLPATLPTPAPQLHSLDRLTREATESSTRVRGTQLHT